MQGHRGSRRSDGQLALVRESNNRVLCVDDETNALSAMERVLRSRYDVVTANSAKTAMRLLERQPFAVVISDLRMPGTDGVQLLAHAREVSPDAVRILISGQADVPAAVQAVNEGGLFRFLLKPCDAASLVSAVRDAAEQHRLIVSERILLEETVAGSVSALVDILAITQPRSFGRATRLKRQAEAVAAELGLRHHWALGVAAQLSQVGYIIVPESTAAKVWNGLPLSNAEQGLVSKLLPFAEQLVSSIPRLEPVRAILRLQFDSATNVGADDDSQRSAAILRTVMAFDELESRGYAALSAVDQLEQSGLHEPQTLNALRRLSGSRMSGASRVVPQEPRDEPSRNEFTRPTATIEVIEDSTDIVSSEPDVLVLPLSEVVPGMHFAEDVQGASGVLLVARGQEVTHSLIARIRNSWSSFADQLQVQVVRVPSQDSAESTGTSDVIV